MTRTYRRWTEEDERRILELVSAHGPDQFLLASNLGVTYNQLHNFVEKRIRDKYNRATEAYFLRQRAQQEVAPVTSKITDLLELPVRPFECSIPAPAPMKPGQWLRAVVITDTHFPYQDDSVLAVVDAVIKDVRPNLLVHLGDILDAGEMSEKFPQNPAIRDTIQDDINATKNKLHQWAALAPQAERWLLCGNHEDRLRRLIWNLKGAQRELAKLDDFQYGLTWDRLFRLKDIGWNWVPYESQPHREILPKLLVKHGTRLGEYAGKNEWMTYGRSGVSGHTHRAHIWTRTDDNGVARWIEGGCTCRMDIPWQIGKRTDWQHTVTVLEWTEDRRLMGAEQPLIRDGQALWRGNLIG